MMSLKLELIRNKAVRNTIWKKGKKKKKQSNSQEGLEVKPLPTIFSHVKVMKSKGTESTHCFNKLVILYQNCVLSPRAYQHHFSFSQLIPSTRPKKKKKRQNAICAVSEWALKFTTSMRFKRIVVF